MPIVLGGHEISHNYEQILSDKSIERDKINGITCISLGLGQPYISNICKSFFPKLIIQNIIFIILNWFIKDV